MLSRLTQRWNWYRNTVTARNAQLDPREVKAFCAEDRVARIAELHPDVLHVFQGIRILDPDRRQGAGEVDTLVVTRFGVIAIETKNWGWDIVAVNGDVAQKKLVDGGKNKPVIPVIEKKVKHLSRWLRSLTNNSELDVFPLIVLAHPKCTPSETVLKMRHVTKVDEIHQSINRLVAGLGQLPVKQIDQITQTIETFGTFDKVTYDGGNFIAGDFLRLPLGWTREEIKSVEIAVHGSKMLSWIRGPKVSVKLTSWDNTVSEQFVNPGDLCVEIKEPWASKSSIKIEHLKNVQFGNQGKVMELQLNPVVKVPLNSSKICEGNLDTSEQQNEIQFTEGMVLENRTVLRHLQSDGKTHNLLVEIIPKSQNGLLSTTHLSNIDPVFFDTLYAEGCGIDVKILKIKNNGDLVLGLP